MVGHCKFANQKQISDDSGIDMVYQRGRGGGGWKKNQLNFILFFTFLSYIIEDINIKKS